MVPAQEYISCTLGLKNLFIRGTWVLIQESKSGENLILEETARWPCLVYIRKSLVRVENCAIHTVREK